MKITSELPDDVVLQELGARLAAVRLARNLTQAALAEEAGVSKRTVERLEAGAVASRVSAFIRVCRALGLADRLEALVPPPVPSPVAQLRLSRQQRRRASGGRQVTAGAGKKSSWTWGDDT